jgi:hypothetical protein
MAFNPAVPVSTDTGPDVITDTRNNLNELKTLIDANVPQSGSGTYALTPTWSGQHIWDGAGIVVKRATGGDFIIYEQKTIEAAHTTAHKLRWLANASGVNFDLRPEIDGVDTPALQLRLNCAAEQWEHGNTGDVLWHGGNFDPLALAPTTMKTGRQRKKVTKLTSSASVALAPDTDGQMYVIQLAHTSTFTFTLPTGSDTDLGDHYSLSGTIVIENITGAGAVTLVATGADKEDTNGTQDNTVGNVMVLAYQIIRADFSGERHIVNFSWVS